RKPPANKFLPAASLRFTHQVKFSRSFSKARIRKRRSLGPRAAEILYTRHTAQAWTGGLASEKSNSYAGICPLACMYHSRSSKMSWSLANWGSIVAKGIMWKARSHAANHGYSHLSGTERTSRL